MGCTSSKTFENNKISKSNYQQGEQMYDNLKFPSYLQIMCWDLLLESDIQLQ